jgi:hypothetical protein
VGDAHYRCVLLLGFHVLLLGGAAIGLLLLLLSLGLRRAGTCERSSSGAEALHLLYQVGPQLLRRVDGAKALILLVVGDVGRHVRGHFGCR